MHRTRRYYPMNAAGDAGGAADLQTDIMRFMAIIALCLVAVFALVQSIPLAPPVVDDVASHVVAAPVATPIEPAVDEIPMPLVESRPLPEAARPVPDTKSSTAEQSPTVAEPTPTPTEQPTDHGFTLRFASDQALTHLVARNEIALYVLRPDGPLRMSASRGGYTFWPASIPNQFHEMDQSTVPVAVRDALRRSGTNGDTAALKWGVTLPEHMRRQLDQSMADHSGGALIIEADGRLRLEN